MFILMKVFIEYKRIKFDKKTINKKYKKLKQRYERYILNRDDIFFAIFFSIMIMEDYNRPIYLRILEYLLFAFRKLLNKEVYMTLGIMQIRTNVFIGNIKSIQFAEKYIMNVFSNCQSSDRKDIVKCVALSYNPSKLYMEEVFKIFNSIYEI